MRPFDADFRGFAQGEGGGFYIYHYNTLDTAWVPGDYHHNPEWQDITLCAAQLGWKASLLDKFDWRFTWKHGEIGIERDIREAGYQIEEVRGHPPWMVKCDAALNPWELWGHTRQPAAIGAVAEFLAYWESLSGR
jgi:hypothetical protein